LDDRDRKLLDEIFSLHPWDEDSVPNSESDKWAYGRSSFKPFSMQFRECNENGNLVHEGCNCCGHKLLMCKKYGGQCISSKCKQSRIRPGGDKQCILF